jgi:ketosteroid isomerase-like protein
LTAEQRTVIVQRFYDALRARDWDALRGLFAAGAELGMSGRNPLAGGHRGPNAIAGVFREMVDRTGGSLGPVRADTWDICSSDHHVVLFEWFEAARGDRKARFYLYFVCAVEDDRIARMFVHSSEQYDFDAFWD